ncbi:MAG TPA: hypothetical protein VGD54_05770 [Steroidobacteraceae bacterium]
MAQVRLGALQPVGRVPVLAYAEKAVSGMPSFELKVTTTFWLVPTATLIESTEAVADTLLSLPGVTGPVGPTFGGGTGGVGIPPPMDVGATVPLSLPRELDPQALNIGSDNAPRRSKRWLSSISFPTARVVQIERRGPAPKIEGLGRYAEGAGAGVNRVTRPGALWL